jgi:hypothetical protein
MSTAIKIVIGNLIGRILGDATVLKQAKGSIRIRIEKMDL